jgi:hypothetical protein
LSNLSNHEILKVRKHEKSLLPSGIIGFVVSFFRDFVSPFHASFREGPVLLIEPRRFLKLPALLAVLVLAIITPLCRAEEISPAGKSLAEKLDAMDVEHHWLPGQRVNWKTGEPIAGAPRDNGKHTHCSAFAAEACRRLGIYLLRPPEHSATLLANAQYDWLFKSGKENGWTQVPDGLQAQHFANAGYVVVAVYKESDPTHPGHIAIIRPSTKSEEQIADEGPQVTQAGGHNAKSTTLKKGFANHRGAFADHKIRFFAHKLEAEK